MLAIGKVRYTQDTRFTPLHEEGNDVWVLKIQETRLSDAGLYECQVSYHEDVEKKLKMPVRLIVLGKLLGYLFLDRRTDISEFRTHIIKTNCYVFQEVLPFSEPILGKQFCV